MQKLVEVHFNLMTLNTILVSPITQSILIFTMRSANTFFPFKLLFNVISVADELKSRYLVIVEKVEQVEKLMISVSFFFDVVRQYDL